MIPSFIDSLPVSSIVEEAFSEESIGNKLGSLLSIYIPDTVKQIGSAAFYKCNDLTGIYFGGDIPKVGDEILIADDAFNNVPKTACTVYVESLDRNVAEYFLDKGWTVRQHDSSTCLITTDEGVVTGLPKVRERSSAEPV